MKKIKTEKGGIKVVGSKRPKEQTILTKYNLKVGDHVKVYARINKYRWYKGEIDSVGDTWLSLRQTKRLLDFDNENIKDIVKIISDKEKNDLLLSEKLKRDKVVYLDDYKMGGGFLH